MGSFDDFEIAHRDHEPRASVLDCGGKSDATPLSHARGGWKNQPGASARKAPSSLRLPAQSKS